MAQFSAKKIDTTTINGGQQVVNGSGVTPELFNAPVESALYTEKAIEVLTNNVDVSQANAVGTPTVSFVSKTEGGVEYKYLKFANLKGETGKTGNIGPVGPEGKVGPVGPKGEVGEAAGFGTPKISVETLDEGSTATASVRATGEDTAKVFNFNFGIPKGDTGRGITTVVSDGNDLIIKYDDKSEERLRGVIQTINALVADSKADFEAAQIEENKGKTISYAGNLYLILGRGSTKLVNNGITDYNALYNTPVYIATSEEAFNSYLQSYNLNKIVSYNGDLYIIVETKNAPIAVGDTIDKLYFDTSVTPDLSNISLTNGEAQLLYGTANNGYLNVSVYDLSVATNGATSGLVIAQNPSEGSTVDDFNYYSTVIYSTVAFEIEPDSKGEGGMSVSQGWQNITDGAYLFDEVCTVESVNNQDLWSSYISKEPFGTITEKKVSGVPSGGTAGQVLTKTTNNDYDAEWADVSVGVTDVQVNGTSVVIDGVANISPASATEGGIITTEAQEIAGIKTFKDSIIASTINSDTINVSDFYVNFGDSSRVTLTSSMCSDASPIIYFRPNSEKSIGLTLINYYSGSRKCTFDLSLGKDGTVSIGINGSKITLPKTTSADSGKFLKVGADGGWVAESVPNAEEASF